MEQICTSQVVMWQMGVKSPIWAHGQIGPPLVPVLEPVVVVFPPNTANVSLVIVARGRQNVIFLAIHRIAQTLPILEHSSVLSMTISLSKALSINSKPVIDPKRVHNNTWYFQMGSLHKRTKPLRIELHAEGWKVLLQAQEASDWWYQV